MEKSSPLKSFIYTNYTKLHFVKKIYSCRSYCCYHSSDVQYPVWPSIIHFVMASLVNVTQPKTNQLLWLLQNLQKKNEKNIDRDKVK